MRRMIFVRQWVILGRANRSIKRGEADTDRRVKNKLCFKITVVRGDDSPKQLRIQDFSIDVIEYYACGKQIHKQGGV